MWNAIAAIQIWNDQTEPVQPRSEFNMALLIRLTLVAVFGGMNLLYWCFMRNGKADYFEAIGKADEVYDLPEPTDEYAPKVERPRNCTCGYDLSDDPDRWLRIHTETGSRCPECGREICPGDYDLTPVPATETSDQIAQEP